MSLTLPIARLTLDYVSECFRKELLKCQTNPPRHQAFSFSLFRPSIFIKFQLVWLTSVEVIRAIYSCPSRSQAHRRAAIHYQEQNQALLASFH